MGLAQGADAARSQVDNICKDYDKSMKDWKTMMEQASEEQQALEIGMRRLAVADEQGQGRRRRLTF